MSNQVYSSSKAKYLASYGNQIYKLSADGLVATTVTAPVIFNTDVLVNSYNPSLSYNKTTGVITVLEDGIYSISANLNLEDNVAPTTNDINFSASIYYYEIGGGTGATYLCNDLRRIPARGAAVGSNAFASHTSVCCFLSGGSKVDIRLTNFSASALKILNSEATFLNIQRIN